MFGKVRNFCFAVLLGTFKLDYFESLRGYVKFIKSNKLSLLSLACQCWKNIQRNSLLKVFMFVCFRTVFSYVQGLLVALCQGSLQTVLMKPYAVQGIKLRSTTCKASPLTHYTISLILLKSLAHREGNLPSSAQRTWGHSQLNLSPVCRSDSSVLGSVAPLKCQTPPQSFPAAIRGLQDYIQDFRMQDINSSPLISLFGPVLYNTGLVSD